MSGTTYDAGALIAAERNSPRMWALHRRLLERGQRPVLSTAVLGQVWRGGPQAQLSRLLRGCLVEPLDERQARSAGTALAASGRQDLIDAAVVVTALAREDMVVTSDPSDLESIASALGRTLALYVI
ncbi:MAG: type II toxin-antitoxin system VapC family toxin [Solirubrobacteraceae bacterium]